MVRLVATLIVIASSTTNICSARPPKRKETAVQETLGKYVLLKPFKGDGMGALFFGYDQELKRTVLLKRVGLDHEQGVELFYNIAVTPWLHVTPDLQFVDAARNKSPIVTAGGRSIGTAVVAGLRVKIDF